MRNWLLPSKEIFIYVRNPRITYIPPLRKGKGEGNLRFPTPNNCFKIQRFGVPRKKSKIYAQKQLGHVLSLFFEVILTEIRKNHIIECCFKTEQKKSTKNVIFGLVQFSLPIRIPMFFLSRTSTRRPILCFTPRILFW